MLPLIIAAIVFSMNSVVLSVAVRWLHVSNHCFKMDKPTWQLTPPAVPALELTMDTSCPSTVESACTKQLYCWHQVVAQH